MGEYYAHPRNRFWKIIATLTNQPLPISYVEKIKLLRTVKIGIWDVAHSAIRYGSVDSNISNVQPNDLSGFISRHKNLRAIVFNGKKSEVLFNKYFRRREALKYFTLPSTSPANTGLSFDKMLDEWKILLTLI